MADVGVDLHRKRSHIVALDPAGEVMLSRRIGNAPAEFLRIFGELEPQPVEVVFEATYGWSWFADLLPRCRHPGAHVPPAGHQGDLAPPGSRTTRSTPTPWPTYYGPTCSPEAWIAPPAAREARRLVRTRAGLVRMRSRRASVPAALAGQPGEPALARSLRAPLPVSRPWAAHRPSPSRVRSRSCRCCPTGRRER
jgi:transposase